MLEGRVKQVATRCAFLIGHWEQKDGTIPEHICRCAGSADCQFNVKQLEELRHADEVHEALKRNQKAYAAEYPESTLFSGL